MFSASVSRAQSKPDFGVYGQRLGEGLARRPGGGDRSADDEALFRINPFTLARERNLPEDEVIDLLLNATSLGLFGMDWLLVCPKCACVVESLSSLKELHHHYHCSMCQVGYEAALDDYFAVTFTVSPEIRAIPFHHPEQLSALDYCFKYAWEARMDRTLLSV